MNKEIKELTEEEKKVLTAFRTRKAYMKRRFVDFFGIEPEEVKPMVSAQGSVEILCRSTITMKQRYTIDLVAKDVPPGGEGFRIDTSSIDNSVTLFFEGGDIIFWVTIKKQ